MQAKSPFASYFYTALVFRVPPCHIRHGTQESEKAWKMTAPQIDIYTDMLCSYCALAKRLLKAKNISFHEIDVTSDSNARAEMRKRAEGRRTVPQIFIDDMHIGGYDDLYLLDKKGLLDPLLAGQSDNLSS
jgi:glutaredoxin 3